MERTGSKKNTPKILIIDDVIINLEILKSILEEENYEVLEALSVQEAIDAMNETLPQLILSDISMPGMDGLEFCRMIKRNPKTRDIPVVFITVLDSPEGKEQAFEAGAADFILKPFERVEVIMRVRNQLNIYQMRMEMEKHNRLMHKLVNDQQKQIEEERRNLLSALAKIIERKNENTGRNLENVGYNSRILAQSLQFFPEFEDKISDDFIEMIGQASIVRDIGNIIIPEKSAPAADDKEMNDGIIGQIQKHHAEEGAAILEEIYSEHKRTQFSDLAISIARYHHERWDGTGPHKLKGNEIPLEARIVTLVDVLDVLRSNRNHTDIHSIEESIEIINEASGKIFDPEIVKVFNKMWKQLHT